MTHRHFPIFSAANVKQPPSKSPAHSVYAWKKEECTRRKLRHNERDGAEGVQGGRDEHEATSNYGSGLVEDQQQQEAGQCRRHHVVAQARRPLLLRQQREEDVRQRFPEVKRLEKYTELQRHHLKN